MAQIQLPRLLKALVLIAAPALAVLGWGGPTEAASSARGIIDLMLAGTDYRAASWLTANNFATPIQLSYLLWLIGVVAWLFSGQGRGIIRPKKTWLKLSDAPFSLAPLEEYIEGAPSWTPVFLEVATPGVRLPNLEATPQPLSKEEAATIDGVPLKSAGIEWAYQRFFLTWSNSKILRKTTLKPWQLPTQPKPEYLSVITWHRLKKDLQNVWLLLRRGLNEVIENEQVTVWAKIGSATAYTYREVPSEAWTSFEVIDWESGTAVSDGKERLYSIHIEPRAKMKPRRSRTPGDRQTPY